MPLGEITIHARNPPGWSMPRTRPADGVAFEVRTATQVGRSSVTRIIEDSEPRDDPTS
jgi:hypothetical protein